MSDHLDPISPTALSLLHLAVQAPSAPLLVTPARVHTRAEVVARVRKLIGWLARYGVAPGSARPVAFVASQQISTLDFIFALLELGVPGVPLHDRWSEAERGRAVELSDAQLISIPDADALELASVVPHRAEAVAADPETPLAIVFSSGSTGQPRGVVLSRRAFIRSAQATAATLPWQEHDRWHLCLPLAHVGGLSIVTRCLLAGKPLALPDNGAVRFDAAKQLQSMQDCSATHVSLVPAQLSALLELERPCPDRLRAVIVGGAALPTPLEQRARSAGWPILRTYGLTEACSQIALQPLREPSECKSESSSAPSVPATLKRITPSAIPSCGRPLANVELRFIDGRIAIRSPTLLSAIVPGGTSGLDQGGWLTTSDLGYFDDHGELVVLGRADEVIVTGGENVSPPFVERVLYEHPAIAAACVFGLEHERWGQEVVAALVVQDGHVLEGLAEWLRERLAPFQKPRRVAFVAELPTTPSGKVDRRACARQFGADCRPLP